MSIKQLRFNSPERNTFLGLIAKEIDSANKGIDIAIFMLDWELIVDPLIRALQRGVAVRIIADQRNIQNHPKLSESLERRIGVMQKLVSIGCIIRFFKGNDRLMHQKILVIDERAFIFSGSWTVYQFQNCYDTCMELDTAHIEQVREWFNKLVAHTYIFEPGYQEYEPVKITKTRNTTFPTFFYGYLRKIYRTLFSLCEETTILCEIATHYAVTTLSKALIPLKKSEREWPSHKLQFFNKSGEARLLMCEAIKSAKNTIHVANYDLSDITVANMLADRCRQGIQVILITQYRSHRKAHYCRKLLRWTRGEVRTLAEKNNLMHHKFMTIDNTYAFISTINFSTRSLDRDLESCYISTQEDIISLLNKEIRSLMSTITFAGDPHAQQ